MDKREITLEDFLRDVHPAYQAFARDTHEYLLQNGCKVKLDCAKNGYLVSYSHVKTKRALANFVFRKGGLHIRIYGEHIGEYQDLPLPDSMVQSIQKAPVCKCLIDPAACNSRCPRGYDFTMRGVRYQKCRYNCFLFAVTEEHIPFIQAFLQKELESRAA